MKQLHAIWLFVATGITALTEIGQMLIDGTKLKFRSASGGSGVRTVLDDSDIRTTLAGNETNAVPSVSAVASAVASATLTVAPSSASYLSIVAGQIAVRPLLISSPIIDTTSTSLANALAARTPVYNATNVGNGTADLQGGDSLILSAHTGGLRVFLHNGGTSGGVGDFTLVEQPQLDNATIRALFSGTSGITYTSATGAFRLGGTLAQATTITASVPNVLQITDGIGTLVVGGGNGVVLNATGGAIGSFRANSTGISATISNGNATLDDSRTTPRGFEYNGDYSAGYTNRSLVDKAYVDGRVSAGISKANVTVNTTAGTWVNVVHNFNQSAGEFDRLVVSAFDSTGELVGLRVRISDANTIQVMTADAVTGLAVRMIKTA